MSLFQFLTWATMHGKSSRKTSRSISQGSTWQAKSDPAPSKTRDSTILTIGRISHGDRDLTNIVVIHHQWWTGMRHGNQYAVLSTLMEKWNIRALCIDTTGLGEGLASLLMDFFVNPSEGHDDFLISLALLCEALVRYTQPPASAVVKPKKYDTDESRY